MKSSTSIQRVGTSRLDAVRVMSPFIFKSAGSTKTDVFDYVRSEMGEGKYQRLNESETLTLENVYICSTPLRKYKGKGLLNHEKAVVELKDGQQGTLLHIKAEKAMATNDKQPSGIFIHWEGNFRFHPKKDVKLKCFSRPIHLGQVLQVMKQQPHNYDPITANCWQYAAAVVRDLVKVLHDGVEDFNENVKNSLGEVLGAAERQFKNATIVIPQNVGTLAVGALTAGTVVAPALATVGAGVLYSVGRSKPSKEDDQ
ncbi:hypothetical protein L7F22_037005 [Adiantum nelumboides]|nr:hypothetical protein [Adiantum nelumboides]